MKVIGVAGGSGSGKTTFARFLADKLGRHRVSILAQDNYYIDQSENFDRDGGAVNFDSPDAIDWVLMAQHVKMLKSGANIDMPIYDFATHKRKSETVAVHAADFLVLDGILIFLTEKLRAEIDLKIYIDTTESVRFARRLKRDVSERGRTEDGVKSQFHAQVKPMHDRFVEPSRQFADLIISGEKDFTADIESVAGQLLG